MGKTKKVLGYTLGIAIVLTAAIFLLNLHLTKRLERYLRKELIHRTAEATDGFYRLSFDNLSISFFKGELKLEGIKLYPDPSVFRDWERKDSLPSTYVTAEVGMIDFKGLNLPGVGVTSSCILIRLKSGNRIYRCLTLTIRHGRR